jgi:ferredoxin-NADP reductase
MPSPIAWRLATITGVRPETPTVRTFTLSIPEWGGHRAGQHVDLRLTAEDGYSVERSYSIASEPERSGEIELTVERIPDGEVSAFLHDVAVPGFAARSVATTSGTRPARWRPIRSAWWRAARASSR